VAEQRSRSVLRRGGADACVDAVSALETATEAIHAIRVVGIGHRFEAFCSRCNPDTALPNGRRLFQDDRS
jgi:hypothetical protein